MGGFRLEGLSEFEEKLKLIERKAPDRIEEKLDQLGNKLRKKGRENSPVSDKTKPNNKRIKYNYKLAENKKAQGRWEKEIWNKAPHFHLVEKGHKKVSKSGRTLGFTPGLHFFEKSVKEFDGEFKGDLDSWVDKLYEELK